MANERLKALTVTVSRCRACPRRLKAWSGGASNYCRETTQDDHLRQIADDEIDGIPEWCPLPDAEE